MIHLLVNHVWQSTLFAGAVGLLCLWLRRDGAHVRFWLWWAASIKFLVPFSLLTAIGSRLAGLADQAVVPDAWSTTAEIVVRPFGVESIGWQPGLVLAGVWIAGAAVLGLRWLVGAHRLRRIVRAAQPDRTLALDNGFALRVYRTDACVEPGVVGLFRPILLLPASIADRLAPPQLEAVLSHEIGHIQRRDNLLAAIHMTVEIVFWFHPLVWWIGAHLIDERERACDELVVATGHDRKTYAAGIIDVCEFFVASPLRCAAGISGSDLKRRITQIMRYQGMKKMKLTTKTVLALSAAMALAVPLFVGMSLQNTARAQDAAPADANEYLPIVKVAPVYPPRAAARGLEGYVIVEYTINAEGSTENIIVAESSSTLFEDAAIQSAQKYKYRPRMVNGSPVAVDGVQTRIIFELEHDADIEIE